jgi:hypothetical protein
VPPPRKRRKSFGTEVEKAVVGQPEEKREAAGQPKAEPTSTGVRRNRSFRAKEPQRDLSKFALTEPELRPCRSLLRKGSIGNRPESQDSGRNPRAGPVATPAPFFVCAAFARVPGASCASPHSGRFVPQAPADHASRQAGHAWWRSTFQMFHAKARRERREALPPTTASVRRHDRKASGRPAVTLRVLRAFA